MNLPLNLLYSVEIRNIKVGIGLHKLDATYFLDKYQKLLVSADEDPFFYGVPLDKETPRILICTDDDVAGFFEFGRTTYDGKSYFRANRPYIAPTQRGKGIMKEALKHWFGIRKPAMAWIDDENISSIRLYQSLGFVNNHPLIHKQKDGHVYFLS